VKSRESWKSAAWRSNAKPAVVPVVPAGLAMSLHETMVESAVVVTANIIHRFV
jgi:hypothetical protein